MWSEKISKISEWTIGESYLVKTHDISERQN